MFRMLVAGLLMLSSASSLFAQEPHRVWWDFLKGEWDYVDSNPPMKGTVKFKLDAKGRVLMSRFKDAEGNVGIELFGWQPDTKTLVITGYGHGGSYWEHKIKDITKDKAVGPTVGRAPDGSSSTGELVIRKLGPDKFEWIIASKDKEGKEVEFKGTLTRKKKQDENR